MVYLIQTKQPSFQKPAKVAQTKKQMDRSNRLACGYSIIRAADIHRFLSLSMLSQRSERQRDGSLWVDGTGPGSSGRARGGGAAAEISWSHLTIHICLKEFMH